ncbi:hypothetical protein Slin15195_G107020 [Septoria linicola]|uniref:Uncharacterized protein n=1 Tax=Septoria linicola TaxID=215465 RepID=A0A9Q9B1V8_9PEZI|nr:hypothetical protein Slin14017_G069990 [Septoria linicola]USW57383.1 hypothetical protein Slin15195_G107020 [Septoria linicola]
MLSVPVIDQAKIAANDAKEKQKQEMPSDLDNYMTEAFDDDEDRLKVLSALAGIILQKFIKLYLEGDRLTKVASEASTKDLLANPRDRMQAILDALLNNKWLIIDLLEQGEFAVDRLVAHPLHTGKKNGKHLASNMRKKQRQQDLKTAAQQSKSSVPPSSTAAGSNVTPGGPSLEGPAGGKKGKGKAGRRATSISQKTSAAGRSQKGSRKRTLSQLEAETDDIPAPKRSRDTAVVDSPIVSADPLLVPQIHASSAVTVGGPNDFQEDWVFTEMEDLFGPVEPESEAYDASGAGEQFSEYQDSEIPQQQDQQGSTEDSLEVQGNSDSFWENFEI